MRFEYIWFAVLLVISVISMTFNFIFGGLATFSIALWAIFFESYKKQLLVVWAVFILLAFLI